MSGCLVPVVISSEQPVNNPLRRCMWSIVPPVLHDREDEVLQMSKLNDICIQIICKRWYGYRTDAVN
jgi:DNA-binding CsgD family transcriptional regulator